MCCSRPRTFLALIVIPILLAAFGSGCSDSTGPGIPGSGRGEAVFEGAVDPGQGSFVLNEIDYPTPDGIRIRVLLVGRNLRVDPPMEQVRLDVSILNIGDFPLYAPGEILVYDLEPWAVWPTNADWADCPYLPDSTTHSNPNQPPDNLGGCVYGYNYSALLGDDGALTPGEESRARTWTFQSPNLSGFSFGATAQFSLYPEHARIGGFFFSDQNENGRFDPNEHVTGGGVVHVNGPGIHDRILPVGEDGRYSISIVEPGLYTLFAEAPPTFAPVRFTTPNPVQVVMPPGPDGNPTGSVEVRFGMANVLTGDAPPVRFLMDPADSVAVDYYAFMGGELNGHILSLDVGFGGCGPDHPFQLYMVAGFMESFPVQARLILSHDDLGEFCDAWFVRTLRWDLTPIINRYQAEYGRIDPIILRFEDWQGETHTFQIGPDL